MILEKYEVRDVKDGVGVKVTLDGNTFWAFPGQKIHEFVRGLTILLSHDLDVKYTTYNGHKRLESITGVF